MKAPFLIGRILFGGFFLKAGIDHLRHRKEMEPYVESKGVPEPKLAVTLSAVPLLVGGTSLLLGVKPKWGALSILAFLAGVSPLMHDFWRSEDPQERKNSMNHFMKNMGLAGGALALMSIEEPWKASVPVGQPSLVDQIRTIGRRIAA
jgi:putative oxidoreductase